MEIFDYRGMPCPQPVIKTKKEIENNPHADIFQLRVDNKAAVENLTRFLKHQGFSADVSDHKNSFIITASREGVKSEKQELLKASTQRNTLVMVTHNSIGAGEPELGTKLMINFIKTLSEIKDSLWRLVFVNEGVKLTVAGSDALSDLQSLEKDGVSILVCGTCLEYYNQLEKKQVGETTNMLDIMTSLQVAEKIINI